MSGPKVVRIVTREEMIAICEGHLLRLDQAIASWIAEGHRLGVLADEERAATVARREALAALIATDAFMELQKKVPEEIAFLKADMSRRQQLAAESAAMAEKRRRQGRHGAATLLDALDAKGVDIAVELRDRLEQVRSGAECRDVDAILARGFSLLQPKMERVLSADQRELANRLMQKDMPADLEAWKATRFSALRDPALDRLDRRIGEARVFLPESEVERFASRLDGLERERDDARWSLLLDSLILDVAAAVEFARTQRANVAELRELVEEIRACGVAESAEFIERARACDELAPSDAVTDLISDGQALIARARQQQAAQARRQAILSGLARLGYEVNEGMETAWASDGRVVVKKSALPGYGVEVGGQAQAGRLQVRAVSLDANRDTSRDKDVETIWCGEFGRLQALLAQRGDDLLIERATGVGEVPLKVVADVDSGSVAEALKRMTR